MSGNKVLVYGGKGALGQAVAGFFKKESWQVLSVDFAANDEADANVILSPADGLTEAGEKVDAEVSKFLSGDKLGAIINVAGGWAGGNAASEDLLKNTDLMIKQSVWTSMICAQLGAKYLKENGLLVLTGAQAAMNGTSGMLAYGAAKAAVHQLTKGLGASDSGLPTGAKAVCIMPITLDTPMNRKYMPDSDFSKWTPLESLAQQMYDWATKGSAMASGSLVKVTTVDGNTDYTVA